MLLARAVHRLAAPLAFGLLVVACRDPSAGPPPERLTPAQAARVDAARLGARPMPRFPADVLLGGGAIRYLGSDVQPEVAPRGGAIEIVHYFEALKPVVGSWTLFVHVEAEQTPGLLANHDHVPVEGLYPTHRWRVGELLADRYSVTLPLEAPDSVAVRIGFYRFNDRMPVDTPGAHDGANRITALRLPVAPAGALPSYRAPRRAAAIVIDGQLGDPGWEGVPGTGPFVRSHDGGKAKYRTEAWLVWDQTDLYVAFRVEDEDAWAKLKQRDDPIYGEEVVEVFLDADGDGKTYNELEVSPANVQFDAYFPARRQGMELAWSSGMESAVRVQGTLNDSTDRDLGWTAELRIPIAGLAAVVRWPPAPGDTWRFNLFRLEWHSDRKQNEGSAFSPPLVGDFHHVKRFGHLIFGG